MEHAAATRREEGAAREAARLAESLEPPATNTSTPIQQGLFTIIPPQPPTLPTLTPTDTQAATLESTQEEERFYNTEIDEELQLPSTSHISGTKELKDDPPEGEINSRKPRKTNPPNI